MPSGYKSTSILSVITQVQNKTHTVLAIVLVTCLQLTQCDVTVCTSWRTVVRHICRDGPEKMAATLKVHNDTLEMSALD